MDLKLSGKVVLLCGASEGMGRGSAEVLAGEGARLALVARTTANVQKTAARVAEAGAPDVMALAADLTDPDDVGRVVSEVVDRFGTIDGLVNAVGLCERTGGFLDQDDGTWNRAFDSVLMTAVRTCRAVVPIMQAARTGAIVNISAMSSRHYLPGLAHYSSQKAAVAHFTKNLAKEFARDGVRANAVLPGLIRSESVAESLSRTMRERGFASEAEYFAHLNEKYDRVTWSDRIGEVTEVGNVVAFLLSERASYVNGALVNVDGGST
jgi:NAD(P)-dependent dehydrogenase (short-subunit alcohol dehydrogenase family)